MNTQEIRKVYLKPSIETVQVEVRQMLASSPLSGRTTIDIDEETEEDGIAE